jgi:uncharacterized protein
MIQYLSQKTITHQLANLSQLTFEVTDACNLKCKYCGYGEFYKDYDKREDKKLPVEKAIRLLDYLLPFWQSEYNAAAHRHVYISFYGGEPLLNMPFIEQVVAYVEQLPITSRTFTFSMTTNAMLLNRYMDWLAAKDFNILVSLDGDRDNNAYRVDKAGHEAFDTIVRNVELLREKYPDYFQRKINFNAVLHNKNSVEEIHRFFKVKYDAMPSIGELNNMGIRPDRQQLFRQTYRNQTESLFQSEHYEEIDRERFIKSPTYQTVCTFLHQYSGFVYHDYNELLYGKPESGNWITGTCPPFGKKMFVTVNGRILPCERIGHQFALGQIGDQGVELDFEAIAKIYNRYFAKLEGQCIRCFNKKSCSQCIFNIEDIDGKPVCYGFTTREDFEQYESQVKNFIARHPEDYYKLMEEVVVE